MMQRSRCDAEGFRRGAAGSRCVQQVPCVVQQVPGVMQQIPGVMQQVQCMVHLAHGVIECKGQATQNSTCCQAWNFKQIKMAKMRLS